MTHTFEVTDRGSALRAVVVPMGADILVAVTGGERPHIGSASVSVPRPSLRDPDITSSTTSTINLTGHKDNAVGDRISAALSAVLKTHVVTVCGIHTDNLGAEGISLFMALSDRLTEMIIKALGDRE